MTTSRRRRLFTAAIASVAVLGVTVGLVQTSSAANTWRLTSQVSGSGAFVDVKTSWISPTDAAGTYLFDAELKNAQDEKVKQWTATVPLTGAKAVSAPLRIDLSSIPDGTYTVHQGVFTEGWASQLTWKVGTQAFEVQDHQWTGAVTGKAESAPTKTTTAPIIEAPVAAPVAEEPSAPDEPVATPPETNPVSGAGAAGNPLAGATLYGANAGAAQQAATWAQSRPTDAALMERMAAAPSATWIGGWSGNPQTAVASVVAKAGTKVPVLVLYNIPNRDCGSFSAGGVGNAAEYGAWIDQVAAGAGTAKVSYVVEPDGITADCADAARYAMIRSAVGKLSANPNATVYIDAGNPGWRTATEMADRLEQSGVANAQGFALNVSNFKTTAENVTYGQQISSLLGGKHFVVDTSRNGNGANGEWCNPTGRALGELPTTNTGTANVDAFIWGKTAGESDGECNRGEPAAGTWWPEYALGLAKSAWN